MPKYVWKFIAKQKKYVLIFVVVSLILAILITGRAYVWSAFFDMMVQALEDHKANDFLHMIYLLGGTEFVLFFYRMFASFLQIKFRGYMNLQARLYGVDHVVEIDYHNLSKIGSGKLLQIIHSGMAGYSFLIYDGLFKSIELFVGIVALMWIL